MKFEYPLSVSRSKDGDYQVVDANGFVIRRGQTFRDAADFVHSMNTAHFRPKYFEIPA